MVMSLCPLCTEVSTVNSLTAETLYQNQALHWNERIRLKLWPFCEISAYFGKIWLPWQRPLDLCNQKCLFWIGRPLKPYCRRSASLPASPFLLIKLYYDFQSLNLYSEIINNTVMLPILIKSFKNNLILLAVMTQFGRLFQWSTTLLAK